MAGRFVESLHAVGGFLIKYKYHFMFIYMLCNGTNWYQSISVEDKVFL
jgi:hypothetical protein